MYPGSIASTKPICLYENGDQAVQAEPGSVVVFQALQGRFCSSTRKSCGRPSSRRAALIATGVAPAGLGNGLQLVQAEPGSVVSFQALQSRFCSSTRKSCGAPILESGSAYRHRRGAGRAREWTPACPGRTWVSGLLPSAPGSVLFINEKELRAPILETGSAYRHRRGAGRAREWTPACPGRTWVSGLLPSAPESVLFINEKELRAPILETRQRLSPQAWRRPG